MAKRDKKNEGFTTKPDLLSERKLYLLKKRGETKIILDFIVYLGSSLFVEEEYLFRLGLSFLIDKLSNILRSKSN